MKTATVTLESVSPYSQSRPYEQSIAKLDKESADAYEKRTWRNRLHVNAKGEVFIPPMSLKNCLSDAAQFLSVKIPGRRNATYTKHFDAGILVVEGPSLGVKADEVDGEWLYLNADGRRGGGTRVWRCYPVIRQWIATAQFMVLDDTVDRDIFEHHLREAGNFIGIGRFRPRNRGFYGRFRATGIEWE